MIIERSSKYPHGNPARMGARERERVAATMMAEWVLLAAGAPTRADLETFIRISCVKARELWDATHDAPTLDH